MLIISNDSGSDDGQIARSDPNYNGTRKRNDSSKSNTSDEDLQVKQPKGMATGSDCLGDLKPTLFQ